MGSGFSDLHQNMSSAASRDALAPAAVFLFDFQHAVFSTVLVNDPVAVFRVAPPLPINNELVFIPSRFQLQRLLPDIAFEFSHTEVLCIRLPVVKVPSQVNFVYIWRIQRKFC